MPPLGSVFTSEKLEATKKVWMPRRLKSVGFHRILQDIVQNILIFPEMLVAVMSQKMPNHTISNNHNYAEKIRRIQN